MPMTHQSGRDLPAAARASHCTRRRARQRAQFFPNQSTHLLRHLLRPPAGAENDGVAPLERDQDLKMNVATGWVAGISPTITPIGLAISHLRSRSKLISPRPTCPARCE